MAVARPLTADARTPGFRLDTAGLLARAGVATLLVAVVLLTPLVTNGLWDRRIALMAIYGIIGLSVNVITGYAGQISLGHQAFVGIGAFTGAYVVGPHIGAGFVVGFVAAGVMGAFLAFALGLVALRVRGLYFALVTLSFGLMTQSTIFNWRSFTGGGAGANSPRPTGFASDQNFAYLCLIFLALFIFVDWRMSKSKAGRSVVALRNNETVASSLGVNVAGYKLLAFAIGGLLAGVAGALFGPFTGHVYANDYAFPDPALIWVLMAVVGGLGSRAGVVIGSAFFAVFPQLLPTDVLNVPGWLQFTGVKSVVLNVTLAPLLGAFLLMLTVTIYPGGIGQQLLPIRRWLAGGPFREPRHAIPEEAATFEAVPVAVQQQAAQRPPSAPPPRPAPRPSEPAPPPPAAETPVEPATAPTNPEGEGEEPPKTEPVAVSSGNKPEDGEADGESGTDELASVTAGEPEKEQRRSGARRGRLFGFRRRKEGNES